MDGYITIKRSDWNKKIRAYDEMLQAYQELKQAYTEVVQLNKELQQDIRTRLTVIEEKKKKQLEIESAPLFVCYVKK